MTPQPIFDQLPIDRSAKADAWDAFHGSQTPEEFQQRMDALPLTHPAKADLWDMKFGGAAPVADNPSPSTEAAGKEGIPAIPEPPKPNQVQRVSPLTPNPPTAAIATTPEAPATLNLQLNQLGSGQRRVVMFPKGQGQPGNFPQGVSIYHDSFGNTYAYRPDLIKKSQISHAAANNKLPEILGDSSMGMGAPDKTALQGPQVVVSAHDADGTEAQSTATDIPNLPTALMAAHRVTPPGGHVKVTSAQQALMARRASSGMPIDQALAQFQTAPIEMKTALAPVIRKRLAGAQLSPAAQQIASRYFNFRPQGDLGSPTPIL